MMELPPSVNYDINWGIFLCFLQCVAILTGVTFTVIIDAIMQPSFRIPTFLAITLHVVLFITLITSFSRAKNYSFESSQQTIIKATVVNAQPVTSTEPQIQPKPLPAKIEPLPKPQPVQKNIEPKPTPTPTPKPIIKPLPIKPIPKPKPVPQRHVNLDLEKELNKELQQTTVTKKIKLTQQNALQQQLASEQNHVSQEVAQIKRDNGEIDKYKALILQTITQNWVIPENLASGLSCQLLLHVAPGGEIISVILIRSSGNELLDRSAKTAVLKSSPLPVPKDAALFDDFREIRLTARPEGLTAN
jgi:colicin import membrane protein